MLDTEQAKGQSVYEHGYSVFQHVCELIEHLKTGKELTGLKLPDWLYLYKDQILLNLHPTHIIEDYTLFHDCGKPSCMVVDIDGKVHFPDHAQVSKRCYLQATGDEKIANLIGWDMCLHLESAVEIEMRCRSMWSVADAATLLLVALSEIHSNAKLFGGLDSISFKAKWKNLDRRGRAVCKHFFGERT